MSPRHTAKATKRYRYYNSRAEDADAHSNPIWSISAPDIETRVLQVTAAALADAAQRYTGELTASAAEIEQAKANASSTISELKSGTGRDQRRIVSALVERVELHQDKMIVSLALGRVDPSFDGPGFSRSLPINSVRSSKQLKLIFPPAPTSDGTNKNPALIKLVTQAAAAREAIVSCNSDDFEEVAAAIGYGREHAADLLKMSYLAPDIVSAILDGRQPALLTRSALIRWAGLPLCWQQQRIALGFA